MNKTNLIIGTVAVLGLVLSFVGVSKDNVATIKTVVEEVVKAQNFGAFSGPDIYQKLFLLEGSVDGGAVFATTTTAAADTTSLAPAVLSKYKVIRFTGSATAAALTATIAASTSPAWDLILPNPGDSDFWFIENGYTAAATTTTIAAGTGIDLQEPDGQNVVIGINNYAKLECYREASTDIVCMVDETIPAD